MGELAGYAAAAACCEGKWASGGAIVTLVVGPAGIGDVAILEEMRRMDAAFLLRIFTFLRSFAWGVRALMGGVGAASILSCITFYHFGALYIEMKRIYDILDYVHALGVRASHGSLCGRRVIQHSAWDSIRLRL